MTLSNAVNGNPTPGPPGAEEPATRLIRRRPLHDEAAERLRDMIVEGHLAAGERVNEADLCAQLGISRTPLREALKVLAAEGLVDLLPRRGARIARLGAREVGELFEVLGGLERTAAELAAARVTAKDFSRGSGGCSSGSSSTTKPGAGTSTSARTKPCTRRSWRSRATPC